MKNLMLITSIICALMMINTNNINAQYQNASYSNSTSKSFSAEFSTVVNGVKNAGYSVVDYDITSLSDSQQFPWDLTCYGGREYVVFGYTEAGVHDLGLYIYDGNGKYVISNSGEINEGITFVKFNANSTATARIIAKNENSVSRLKKYKVGIVVAYRNKL